MLEGSICLRCGEEHEGMCDSKESVKVCGDCGYPVQGVLPEKTSEWPPLSPRRRRRCHCAANAVADWVTEFIQNENLVFKGPKRRKKDKKNVRDD